jgi:hypothetical protein
VATETTTIRKIRKSASEELPARFHVFHVHIRKISEHHAQLLEEHYLQFILSQKERVLQFLVSNSWILKDKRIKDYMVASYLGIDRATYSRFRKGR